MADSFVIYTLGDVSMFRATLNGIAMIFNNSSLFKGNGAFGMGTGAAFGAMILLLMTIYGAVFKQRFDIKLLVAPLLVYIMLTVPKVTVTLVDVSSNATAGQAAVVDNIPIGLALPASVASGISYELTGLIETAYQTVAGTYYVMPRITDSGYVTPLKLINSMRDSTTRIDSPNYLETTKNFYETCLRNNEKFSAQGYKNAKDPLGYIETVVQNQMGLVWMVQTGGTSDNSVSCTKAAQEIKLNLEGFLDGGKKSNSQFNLMGNLGNENFKSSLTLAMERKGNMSGINPKGSNGQIGYGYDDVKMALGQVASLSENNARNFVLGTLFNPYLETASYCADKNQGLNGLSRCTAWVSNTNQWEEKNAAAATGFLKVLQDGQNILIMLSFMLFPLIVIFIMVQGTGSFKLLGNYLSFTISAYMWLPMAAIINFYIQNTLTDEFFKIGISAQGISLMNGDAFYNAVSQKLALANGMLASVPMLCMMLFSGMMMGMNSLTSRMNQVDSAGYDASVNNPDIQKSAPLHTANSIGTTSGAGVYSANDVGTHSISLSNSMSSIKSAREGVAQSQQHAFDWSNEAKQVMSKDVGTNKSTSSASGSSTTAANTQTVTDGTNKAATTANTASSGEGFDAAVTKNAGRGEQQNNSVTGAAGVGAAANASTSTNQLNKAETNKDPNTKEKYAKAGGGASANADATAVNATTVKNELGQNVSTSNKANGSTGDSSGTTNSSTHSEGNASSYTQSDLKREMSDLTRFEKANHNNSQGKAARELLARADTIQKTWEQQTQAMTSISSDFTAKPNEVVGLATPEHMQAINNAIDQSPNAAQIRANAASIANSPSVAMHKPEAQIYGLTMAAIKSGEAGVQDAGLRMLGGSSAVDVGTTLRNAANNTPGPNIDAAALTANVGAAIDGKDGVKEKLAESTVQDAKPLVSGVNTQPLNIAPAAAPVNNQPTHAPGFHVDAAAGSNLKQARNDGEELYNAQSKYVAKPTTVPATAQQLPTIPFKK